jgi:F0F1-type ATP synthase membrane subunit a
MQLLTDIIEIFPGTLPLFVLIQGRLFELFAQTVDLALQLLFIIILAGEVIMCLTNGFPVFLLRFLGVLSRYAGLLKGIQLGENNDDEGADRHVLAG